MKTDYHRPDPDKLLSSIKERENAKKRGKLKIFFGMSPGVGKTYTMLQTAQIDKSKGVDVVIGYVEVHNRPETTALLENLEIISRKRIEYKGTFLEEMDLDAILLRHPYLVLVDELAHTNAPGSRHAKRYQDVQELLNEGINVYTTVNIQHIESRNDTVAQITGVTVRETIPDEIFEEADEVELIDITPNTLFDRLAEGKIYSAEQSKEAVQKFFRQGNITALREMALRLVADRVDRQLKNYMQQKQIEGPWKSGLHLMVLVGPSESSSKLIRWAKNLSYTMGADLTALHVENTQVLTETQQEQLTKNIDLARQFGAEIIITSGNNLASTTLEIARKENITHIIIGKSGKQSILSSIFRRDDFVNRLLKGSGEIDIYVIEPGVKARQYKKKFFSYPEFSFSLRDSIFAVLVVFFTILLCLSVSARTGYQAISFILLFVILILSIFFKLSAVMTASAVCAMAWNYFFIPPLNSLKISRPEDFLAFCMFFVVALVTGTLTSKVRRQERLTRKREEKINALFHLTNHLATADNIKYIIEIARVDIKKYFGVKTFFLLQDGSGKLKKKQITEKLSLSNTFNVTESEFSVAQWVFKHSKKAGKFTDTLSSSNYTFYPLKGTRTKQGVIIIQTDKKFSGETELFWDIFLTQISNTFEHHYFAQMARKATLRDVSDKMYKTLLNMISKELRTPVTTIRNDLGNMSKDTTFNVFIERHTEMLKASSQLNRLVENLSTISLLETGEIVPQLEWCDVSELFDCILNKLEDELQPYQPDKVVPPQMPLVKFDFALMEYALYNLVYNSCKYSIPGTTIRLKAFYDEGSLIIQEMDRGPGFSMDIIHLIFNKFYKIDNQINEEGLGLGLTITKGLVEAHKGIISVENRQHGGARFTIKIPTEISYKQSPIIL